MRKLFLILGLALWPAVATALCEGTDYLDTLAPDVRADIDATIARTPFAKGLIWRAEKSGRVLHVVGTMHIYDPRLGTLMQRVTPLVKDADLLLVEAGPNEEATMQSALARDPGLVFITDGPTLPEQLSDESWEALVTAARARQIPAFLAAKMQPWYLALALAIPVCAMPDVAAGVRGLDHLVMSVANGHDVPIMAVEPWDTLFTLMKAETPEDQLGMLEMGLVPEDLQTALFVSMLNSYFAEDVVAIWEASRVSAQDIPGIDPDEAAALFARTEEAILLGRNRAWIAPITAATAENPRTVLAVGAAHLPGEQGVLRLLEQDGWTITAGP